MEMECPHSTIHRIAPAKWLIVSGNDGSNCGINDLRVLVTDADLHSPIYDSWELCVCRDMCHIPGNEDAPGKIKRFHATLAAESTIFWLPFLLVPK